MGSAVGIAATKPAQYRRFEMLKSVSSTSKLNRLFNYHPSPAVKCYSFWALSERHEDVNNFALIKYGISDDRTVPTMFGCIVGRTTVADFLIDNSRGLISVKDSLILDSLIIFSNKKLGSQRFLLLSIAPEQKYYERIKELSKNPEIPSAIVGLAKFQKVSDIDFIINTLTDSLKDPYFPLLAVKSFPNEAFVPYVLSLQDKMIIKTSEINSGAVRALYKALVRLDNKTVKEKLEWVVQLDNEIRSLNSLPDSIKVIGAFEKEFLNIKPDSTYYLLKNGFGKENEYSVHHQLWALRLALFEFPESKYQYLVKDMKFEDYEIDMIKNEIELTDFE